MMFVCIDCERVTESAFVEPSRAFPDKPCACEWCGASPIELMALDLAESVGLSHGDLHPRPWG